MTSAKLTAEMGADHGRPPGLLARLPLTRSLQAHDSSALAADLTAGLTVGVMLIPQGMAYALIAGLPPVYGLYAALVPLAMYALLGTSRQLAVGPVAMVALLVANGVGPMADGDPERYIALAVALALLTGAVQLLMGVLHAGFLVNLLSHPVLAGFTSAAAIIIGMSQLGGLTGLAISKGEVHHMVSSAAGQLAEIHLVTLAIGVGATVGGLALKRWAPRLPAAMIIVALGTAAAWILELGAKGVTVVGDVPSGLPSSGVPQAVWGLIPSAGTGLGPDELIALLPVALTIALVGFMESIAVAKVYATRDRYDLDADQELKALGLANIAGAFFQSFPVTGGFSRTAVNAQSGARSQLSSLVSVAVVVVTLLFLTPLFYHLPKAILAAIILVAVAGLVDLRTARQLWHVDRRDFGLMLATFLATLFIGIEEGIVVGAALSVIVVIQQITTPHIAILGRLPGTTRYGPVERHPDARIEAGIIVMRMDASLFYGNAEGLRDAARAAIRDAPRPFTLIIDAYPINRTDSTGLHALSALVSEIRALGGDVSVAGAKSRLMERFVTSGLVDLIGEDRFHPEIYQAVESVQQPAAA